MNENYFYVQEAEQFVFYRVPKAFFTNEKYKKMSSDSKLLYGLLLERVGLSLKNEWVDEEKRIYIYFSREEAMEMLGIKKDKTIKLFKELQKYDLIKEIRQGLNKPNKIYVKKFTESVENTRKSEKPTSRVRKNPLQELEKTDPNNNEFNNTELSNKKTSCQDSKNPDEQKKITKKLNPEIIELTELLIRKILENNPRQPVPEKETATYTKWVQEMDRLNRLGPPGGKQGQGYSVPEIKELILWSQENSFWKDNILSAGKFREQIIKLENKMKSEKSKKINNDQLEQLEQSGQANKHKNRFHNFEQRTSKYDAKTLEKMFRKN